MLRAVEWIQDELWRARTLFSLIHQMSSRLTRKLPKTAQDEVVALVKAIGDEAARTAALRNLSADLPAALRTRLAGLGKSIADPLRRLQVALHYAKDPNEERTQSFLETAKRIEEEEARGEALAIVAPLLSSAQLEEAFAAAEAIRNPDVVGRALVRIAELFPDDDRRQLAHAEILTRASSIANPLRKFDVIAALHDLPVQLRPPTETLLFDLAIRFDDPNLRCRALLMAGGFAQDEALRQRAFLAGLAAAEGVLDEQRRAELFLLFRPGISWLSPEVRRELTRAVERLENAGIRNDLHGVLGRFFVYERSPRDREEAAPWMWDVFISYATADLEERGSWLPS